MDRIIEVKVNGNYLFKDNKNAGVQYEANVTSLRIEFDAGWDGYAKKVTFWDAVGGNPVERTLTTDLLEDITKSTRIYLCPIPGEPMLIAGNMTFVIDGYVDGKRQRSISDKLRVKEAPFKETAGEPADPTPTQAEQLQAEIDRIQGTIQNAAQSAEDARASAEAAKNSEIVAESAAANAGLWAYSSAQNGQLAADARVSAESAQAAAEAAQAGAEAARDQAEAIAGGDFATKPELAAHTGDSNIHVTAEEKSEWNERDVFIATYGTTTSAEIEAAYQAGKAVFCKWEINSSLILYAPLWYRASATGHGFACFDKPDTHHLWWFTCKSDKWGINDSFYADATHASTHASDGDDPITPESIGAAPAYTYGTEDLTAGTSELETGKLYFVFE